MKNNPKNLLKQFQEKLLSQNGFYHGLFWMIILALLMLIEGIQAGFFFTLSNQLINVFFYAVIVYFNLFYLIPNYLSKNLFLTYGILLIVASVVLTPLKMIIFVIKFENYPELQKDVIDHQFLHILLTFLIAGASTVYKIFNDWFIHVSEKQELEKQTMQSELRFLKSQINPHFLFNTLNNLYALTLKKSDKAPEIVIKLSEMMRYMLYECNEKRVMLSKEVNYIKNYIDLESLRQGKNVKIDFQLFGDPGHRMIAPLMFTPFLENSFKHGVGNLIANGFVNIKLNVNGDDVDFFIENSKPDKPPTSIHKDKRSGGIGLVNVQKRLNLLYPEKYDLQIKDTPNAYAVHLKINLDE